MPSKVFYQPVINDSSALNNYCVRQYTRIINQHSCVMIYDSHQREIDTLSGPGSRKWPLRECVFSSWLHQIPKHLFPYKLLCFCISCHGLLSIGILSIRVNYHEVSHHIYHDSIQRVFPIAPVPTLIRSSVSPSELNLGFNPCSVQSTNLSLP